VKTTVSALLAGLRALHSWIRVAPDRPLDALVGAGGGYAISVLAFLVVVAGLYRTPFKARVGVIVAALLVAAGHTLFLTC
jgi:hypothetical protein